MSVSTGRALRAAKTPRAALIRLHVTGDLCPNLLPRLLGLVAQFDLIPCDIALTKRVRSLRLALDLERADPRRAEILLHKVARSRRCAVHVWPASADPEKSRAPPDFEGSGTRGAAAPPLPLDHAASGRSASGAGSASGVVFAPESGFGSGAGVSIAATLA